MTSASVIQTHHPSVSITPREFLFTHLANILWSQNQIFYLKITIECTRAESVGLNSILEIKLLSTLFVFSENILNSKSGQEEGMYFTGLNKLCSFNNYENVSLVLCENDKYNNIKLAF